MNKLIRKGIFFLNNRRVKINGEKIKIPYKLHSYFSLLANNLVENELISYIDKIVKKGDVFVDIGANIGIISSFVSKKVGSKGLVFSFEPNPRIYNLLHQLLSENAIFNNFIINQSAISDSIGIAQFSISMEDSVLMERSGLIKIDDNSDQQIVCTTTLDGLFGNEKVDWVKIDVEGAELQVLEGAVHLFENQKPGCMLEIHGLYFDNPKAHARRVFDFFTERGYKAFNIMKNEWETCDSFIIDSGVGVFDRVNKVDLSKSCYGNIAFLPD